MGDPEPISKRLKSGPAEDRTNVEDTSCEIQSLNVALLKEANKALQESNRLHVRPIVDETKLGIELFVGDKQDEFHGLIKTRYGDFIVHEIDPDGQMAVLTSLDAPEEQEPTTSMSLSDFVDAKALECLAEVNNGYLNEYKIDVTGMDKDTRTSLHHAIKASFDRLESSTLVGSAKTDSQPKDSENLPSDRDQISEDNTASSAQQVDSRSENTSRVSESGISNEAESNADSQSERKFIVVTRRNKSSRAKNVWPRDRPDHTHFILYKENKDTMDAIHNLAAAINARPSNFSYAGVKDRRAITTQWVSSWRLEPRRLISVCKRFNKRPFIKVGNFEFKREPMRLGHLRANKFDIVIRHLVYSNDGVKVIEKSMNCIKENGFVNYFGLQRFGTRSIQTHEIGLAILQEKWEQAVDLILSYRFDDNMQPPSSQQNKKDEVDQLSEDQLSRREKIHSNEQFSGNKRCSNGAEQHNSFIDLWKSKLDAEIVFKKYPHYRFTNEGLIMKSLSKSEESSREYLNSLTSLPRTTRSLYVHSYQSLLWNKIATFRLKKYGFTVVPGDLILSPISEVSDNSLDILLTADEVEINEENKANNSEKSQTNNGASRRRAPIEEIASKIEVATEENCSKYSIFDVVLPIIGSRVRLPENDVGAEINRLLKLDDLTLDSFKVREKLFISYGSYRKIMVKPNNVKWYVKQYSNPQLNLVETDLDKLNRELSSKDKSMRDEKSVPISGSDSSDEALVVEFELPPSSYATMCLREIMKKPSTDFNSQF